MSDLCKQLGIPRRTFCGWVNKEPDLAVYIEGGRGGGSYWVKLDKLIGRHGLSWLEAYTLTTARWIKATDLARLVNIPRRTLHHWCLTRPGFGKRIGKNYYVNLEQLGADMEDVEQLVGYMSKATDLK